MSSLDPEKADRELADIAVGVVQEWSMTYTSRLVPDIGAVSLHRDFRNFEGFARNAEHKSAGNAQDLSGLSPSYGVRGPAMIALFTGGALDRLGQSNRAGEVVELTYSEQTVLDGIMTITTFN